MQAVRGRRQSGGLGLVRALVFILVVLTFVGAAVLFTSRPHVPSSIHLSQRPPQPFSTSVSGSTTNAEPSVRQPPDQPSESGESSSGAQPAESPPQEAPPSQVAEPSSGVAGDWSEVSRGSGDSRRIALTFDAGADSKPTPDILETLAKHNVHATFFLTGRWIERNPELVRRIASEGHEIGNHTYSHRRLTTLSTADIVEEAEKTELLVLKLTGRSTKPLLRVPYGSRDKRVLSVLKEQGYRSIYWDVDSWDSVRRGVTPAEIERRVLARIRNGSIVLMHCGSKATADTLDSLLEKLLSAGYEQVTVSGLLTDQPSRQSNIPSSPQTYGKSVCLLTMHEDDARFALSILDIRLMRLTFGRTLNGRADTQAFCKGNLGRAGSIRGRHPGNRNMGRREPSGRLSLHDLRGR